MYRILALFALIIIISKGLFAQINPPDTLWTKTFGRIYNDWGADVQQTSDGGYIIAANKGSSIYDDLNYDMRGHKVSIKTINLNQECEEKTTQIIGSWHLDKDNNNCLKDIYLKKFLMMN